MASSAFLYNNGYCLWSLSHQSDKGIYNLEVEGSPPEFFEGVRARLLKEQDDNGGTEAKVDYVFDIPVELASMFCGYRHDRWKFDWGQPSFTCLRETIQK